jgi:hypothetical protein
LPGSADPAEWTVVFFDDDFANSGRYPGTASGFLRELLTGAFTHELFTGFHVDVRRFFASNPPDVLPRRGLGAG